MNKVNIFLSNYKILMFIIIFSLIILTLHPVFSLIIFIILIIFSLKKSKYILFVLMLGFLIPILNRGVFKLHPLVNLLKPLLFLIASLRIYFDSINKKKLKRYLTQYWVLWFFIFVLFTLFISVFNTFDNFNLMIVSLSKLLLFTIIFFAVILLLSTLDYKIINNLFKAYFYSILLLSLPFVILPIGYLRNARGFQGILHHPQAFAILLLLPTLWYINELKYKKINFFDLILLISAFTMILLTKSRTVVLTVFLVLFFNIILSLLRKEVHIKHFLYVILKPRYVLFFMLIILLVIYYNDFISMYISNFFLKRDVSLYTAYNESLLHSFEKSRGEIIEQSWRNFSNNIWRGIGFGLPSSIYELNITYVDFGGLTIPISAPTEKSFIVTALLEETGIIGTFLFFMFWIALLIKIIDCNESRIIYLAILFVCFGEMMFFSTFGLGLYLWIFIGWSIAKCKNKRMAI